MTLGGAVSKKDTKDVNFDFSKPEDARKFLRDFRFANGTSIELLRFPDGSVVNVLAANDFEVGHYALMVCNTYIETGYGYLEDTEIH